MDKFKETALQEVESLLENLKWKNFEYYTLEQILSIFSTLISALRRHLKINEINPDTELARLINDVISSLNRSQTIDDFWWENDVKIKSLVEIINDVFNNKSHYKAYRAHFKFNTPEDLEQVPKRRKNYDLDGFSADDGYTPYDIDEIINDLKARGQWRIRARHKKEEA